MHTIRKITTAASAAALFASPFAIAPSMATPGSNVGVSGVVNGHFGTIHENTADGKTGKWGLILKTLDDTDIGADQIILQGGGYTGWHNHPAPVFVTVIEGEVVWYDGSDALCTGQHFSVGQSYIEPAWHIHNAVNASGSAEAKFIAVRLNPTGTSGPAFRVDQSEPNNCKF
jgi:quercetin dioxygenase-like cupin family protein